MNSDIIYKEIDLIQSCINRMAKNSFSCKSWNLTLVAGVFALVAEKINTWYICIIIMETKNPVFSMLSSVKCRNSQEINDFSTLSDTLFYPLSQNQKYLQSGFHPNPEGYRKSTVRLDNC